MKFIKRRTLRSPSTRSEHKFAVATRERDPEKGPLQFRKKDGLIITGAKYRLAPMVVILTPRTMLKPDRKSRLSLFITHFVRFTSFVWENNVYFMRHAWEAFLPK